MKHHRIVRDAKYNVWYVQFRFLIFFWPTVYGAYKSLEAAQYARDRLENASCPPKQTRGKFEVVE